MDNKFLFAAIFFIFILISGFWLSHAGKPINVLALTIHKLISLATLVFLIVSVYRLNQTAPLSPVQMAACAITILFFIAMFATGGLLSAAKTMPEIIHKIHQVMPYLVILSTLATLSLLHFSLTK